MKNVTITLTMVVFLLGSAGFSLSGQQAADVQQKQMMEKWMKFATPGEPHKFLEKQVGEWDMVSKMWMKPGDPPSESKGSASGKMILGGRYLKTVHKGVVMGMPLEGINIGGYDNYLKEYFSIWIDNMGTGIMFSKGNLDKTGKILTEVAEIDDFMTGQKMKARSVTTCINKDKLFLEMYMIGPDGKEFKSMEVTYIRKK